MRTLISIFTALLLLTSCAHGPRGGDLARARESVYKVQVSMELDLEPLRAWKAKKAEERKKREEERRKKEEGGETPPPTQSPPSIWPRWWSTVHGRSLTFIDDVPVALNQTQEVTDLHVLKSTGKTTDIGWSGTGWVVAQAPGRSFVMTAGHVCESRDSYQIEVYDIDWEAGVMTTEKLSLPILNKRHIMISRDGVESVNSVIVRDEDLDENFNGNDLCVLGTTSQLGPPISIGEHDPEYGQTCSVVGAPTGLWGGGIAVASEAIYSGRGAVFGTDLDGLAFNGLLAPGNSGSSVVCDGKAVGVISLGATRFRSLIHAVPHERMRTFLDLALHQKK
jgi:hypothetical protein